MSQRATFSDWAGNLVAHGLIRGALLLPYRTRVAFFGKICAYGIAPIAGYYSRAKQNVARVWPQLPQSEVNQIARKCCDNFGRTIIENYSGDGFQNMVGDATLHGPGVAALEQAKADGRPVVFVSGHFGNFEAPRRALTSRGYAIGGIYRKMSNPLFNAHYEKTMMDVSGPVFAQGNQGVLQFVRYLKKGGMGTILFDVRANKFPDLDFLGHDAPTSPAAAEFATRFDALMIPYFGRRLDDGVHFEVIIGTPIEKAEPEAMMQAATDQLAAMVTAHPEQYFWVHRRWRTSPRKTNS